MTKLLNTVDHQTNEEGVVNIARPLIKILKRVYNNGSIGAEPNNIRT